MMYVYNLSYLPESSLVFQTLSQQANTVPDATALLPYKNSLEPRTSNARSVER